MDLQSYIQLRSLARDAMTGAHQIEEQVETVEEEILDEIRMLKPGQSVKDYDAEAAKRSAEASKNKDKVVPNRGAYDTLSKIQQDASTKRSEKQKAAKADTSGMSKWQRRRAARRSSSASAIANTNSSGQALKIDTKPTEPAKNPKVQPVDKAPVDKAPVDKAPVDKAPVTKAPVQTAQQKQDAKTNAAYDKMRKTDPIAAAAQGKAVAKAKFGDQLKPKTANPLMKKMGLSKPAPKAAPSPGAKAAMNAAKPMKSSRLQKALTDIKPMKEDFDLILEHLIEQGFPQEEALKLMVSMSEEKREQILETTRRVQDNASGARGPEFVGPAKAALRTAQNASGARGPEFVKPAQAKQEKLKKATASGSAGMSPTRSGDNGTPMKEELKHRDAKTGEVTDKPEVGKTYYTDGPRQKSSVAIRKEKEAAERKKTNKEEMDSLFAAYQTMLVSERKELSIDDQMRISQEHNRKSAEEKKEANKKAMGKVEKVAPKKDERTDAEKMTDATGPRKGSNYRGD